MRMVAWMGGAVAGLVLAAGVGAVESDAVRVVQRLNDALVGMLKDAETLGYQGRFERITPVVNESYDTPYMAEKSLGQGWKTLTDADRQRWIELSREFSAANYAANFDHWSGQSIELLGEERGDNDTTVVRTRIVDPKGDNVDMSYRLHRTPAGWQIIDVYLKGTVSELALRRADYSSVLARDGFEGLVTLMRGKLADLAAGRGTRKTS
jgi:phospholipid transport system substrate-binding protein